MLRGFDAVEELPVDVRLACRGDRAQQDRRALRISTRDRLAPPTVPPRPDGLHARRIDPVEVGRLVEQRVADAAVAPVEQGQRRPVAARVARVEVAVHEGVREAGVGDRLEPSRQVRDERVEEPAVVVAKLWRRVLCDGGDGGGERRCPPVGEPEGEELVDPADPVPLQPHEEIDERLEDVAPRTVEVPPRDLMHEDARAILRDESGNRAAGEAFEDGPLVGEEGRHVLQPDGLALGPVDRDPPECREVPRADLRRWGRSAQVGSTKRIVRPGDVGRRAVRSGPRQPQGVVAELAVPRLELGRRRLGDVERLRDVRHEAPGGDGPLRFEQAQDDDPDAVPLPCRPDDRLGLRPPRRVHVDGRQRPDDPFLAVDEDEPCPPRRDVHHGRSETRIAAGYGPFRDVAAQGPALARPSG
jgi:hypothetical protein